MNISDSDMELESKIVAALKKHGLKISFAESCTGGMLASRIVDVSGASSVFEQSFVTYSNSAKNKILGVDNGLLNVYGAVSTECAKEMASGLYKVSGSDICISVTGIAGPSMEEGKAVGLVYIGCCYRGNVEVKEFLFDGDRQSIREQACNQALLMAGNKLQ